MGFSFLEGWFDASLILVQRSRGTKEPTFSEKLVSWAGPLSPEVWALCVVSAFFVGLAYWVIENHEDGSDLDREASADNAIASCFSALLLFTGGGGPGPRTFAGNFLLFGWSLFILVVINGYAANLVAFLVKKAPALFPMKSIDDGHERGLPVCAWTTASPGPIMKSLYPNLNLVPSTSSSNVIINLNEGKCDGAVMVKDDWMVLQSVKSFNGDCDKFKTGDTIYPSLGGWGSKTDAGVM